METQGPKIYNLETRAQFLRAIIVLVERMTAQRTC